MPFKTTSVTAGDVAIAGGLVALAIMLTNHWTISTQGNVVSLAARLNRWTGEIELCAVNPSTLSGTDIRGGKVECTK